MTDTLFDGTALARVLVMPGAAELFEAFSRIPPGPLRDSVIAHARVIAQTYADAPPQMQMPDPLLTASQAAHASPGEAPALPGQPPKKARSAEERAVQMRLERRPPHEIATELGISFSDVTRTLREAKAAGVDFPPLTPKNPPPEWKTDISQIDAAGMSAVVRAAEKRGLAPQAYLDRRVTAVMMAQQNIAVLQIAEKLGERTHVISGWLTQARASGIDIPFTAPEYDSAPPPPLNTVTFPLNASEMHGTGGNAIIAAAQRLGMSLDDYFALRRRAVDLFRQGLTASAAAAELNLDIKRLNNWKYLAKRCGKLNGQEAPA